MIARPAPAALAMPTGADLAALALRLADHARALGMRGVTVRASRVTQSGSRYLRMVDAAGRPWVLRVSEHCSHAENGHARPHYDLITRRSDLDGALEAARGWMTRVADGLVAWTDPDDVRQPRRRRR